MNWPALDEGDVIDRLVRLGHDEWAVRSWMVDRHEVLTTVVVNLASATPQVCGVDLLTDGEVETSSVVASPWWIDPEGHLQRAGAQRMASAPEEAQIAQLLHNSIAACEASHQVVASDDAVAVHFEVDASKIDELLGRRASPLKAIERSTGALIEIDETRTPAIVTARSSDEQALAAASSELEEFLNPPIPVEGGIYRGRVVNITKFGAFVNIVRNRDGLLHISRLSALAPSGHRVDRVEDVLALGQELDVRVDEIEPTGKIALSLATERAREAGSVTTEGEREARSSGPRP